MGVNTAYSNQNLEIKNFRRGYVKLESIDVLNHDAGTTNLNIELTDPDGLKAILSIDQGTKVTSSDSQ